MTALDAAAQVADLTLVLGESASYARLRLAVAGVRDVGQVRVGDELLDARRCSATRDGSTVRNRPEPWLLRGPSSQSTSARWSMTRSLAGRAPALAARRG